MLIWRLSRLLVIRTPLRISFVGGGSDMQSFYKHSPGSVITCSINKYIYIYVLKKDLKEILELVIVKLKLKKILNN